MSGIAGVLKSALIEREMTWNQSDIDELTEIIDALAENVTRAEFSAINHEAQLIAEEMYAEAC